MNNHSKLMILALSLASVIGFSQVASAQGANPCSAKWEEVDKNGDGKVLIDEANDALKAKFSDVDKNANGAIELAEYEACQKA